MQHCSVVFPSKFRANRRERAIHEVAALVHGYLTSLDDVALAGAGKKRVAADVEIVADCLLDLVYGQVALDFPDQILGDLGDQIHGYGLVGKGRVGDQRDKGSLQFTEIGRYLVGEIFQHIIGDVDSFAKTPVLQHREPRHERRTLELDGKSPFKTAQKPLLEILQVRRSTVRGEYQLFAVFMEMVEDIEEGVLRGRTNHVLDVIDDEDIYLHVEGEEIRELIANRDGIHVLSLELVSGHIENRQVRILVLYRYSDRLCDMGLAEARTSEEEERVERSLAWGAGDALAGRDAHLVALPFHEIVETVDRIQSRIDLDTLETRVNERSRIALRRVSIYGDGLVDRSRPRGGWKTHRRGLADRADLIDEFRIAADHSLDGSLHELKIHVVEVLPEEIRRHLKRKSGADKRYRLYRSEPGIEFLRLYYLADYRQTILPHG